MSATPSLRSATTPSKRPLTPPQLQDKDLESASHPPPTTTARDRLSHISGELAWNASHPCYPHPNPYVPLTSPLHASTRIIRIPRDWMVVGDLAPCFSNTYPEILEPWVSEEDFRLLVKGVNERLIEAFDPLGWRAWVDGGLGVATGWLWEDLGFAGVKGGCRRAEEFVLRWNGGRKGGLVESEEGEEGLVRAVELWRTGYLSLDIQIPDPKVGMTEEGVEREGEGKE